VRLASQMVMLIHKREFKC